MNWELWTQYGAYNKDNYYIGNHDKWDYYAKRPKLYKRKKIIAWLFIFIFPVFGIIITDFIFSQMGLEFL